MKMPIIFLSNHADLAPIRALLPGETIVRLPHPLLQGSWTVEEIEKNCADVIAHAVAAPRLIANGDYTLVSLIVLARAALGRQTGFVGMDKVSAQDGGTKRADGTIAHQNVLRPVSIRWVGPGSQ